MRYSAPSDIAGDVRTVLDAVAASASRLGSGAPVREVAEPVSGDEVTRALLAPSGYTC